MRKFTKILCAVLAAVCMVCAFASCSKGNYKTSNTGKGLNVDMTKVAQEIDSMKAEEFEATDGDSDYVLLKIKDYGDIVIVLRDDIAPITVENFKKLVSEGFYDGTIFHRVIEGFMIQGGGFDENYTQKNTDTIKGEFSQNNVKNNLTHIRGVISMARTSVMDSATSQFFIVHEDSPYLNGAYASFGYVIAGMDVVDAIATCEVAGSSDSPAPVENVVIESATFVVPK